MTTLAEIRRVLSVRGIDPDQLDQTPTDQQGAGFVFTPPSGARMWFAPLERGGWRIGWHYIATAAHGALIDCGQTDTTQPEGLLPVLRRHSKPSPTVPRPLSA